jgi:hypothetical protein
VADNLSLGLDRDQLLALYRALCLTRAAEERVELLPVEDYIVPLGEARTVLEG